MKRFCILVLAAVLMISSAQATIVPSMGEQENQLGVFIGVSTPGYILCESLSVYDARGDQGGRKIGTLKYRGDGNVVAVLQSWDGWAEIGYEDGNSSAWVHNEYLLMNPDWYICDEAMAVYAYDDNMAPRIAWVEKGTKLAIIRDLGDWVQVSIRTATGYIKKTAQDRVQSFWFQPELLGSLVRAELTLDGSSRGVYEDAETLAALADLLVNAEPMMGGSACPFTATLTVTLVNGQQFDLQLATDSCCAYIVDGVTYAYARHLKTPDSGVDNMCLFSLFGIESLW